MIAMVVLLLLVCPQADWEDVKMPREHGLCIGVEARRGAVLSLRRLIVVWHQLADSLKQFQPLQGLP